MGYIAFASAKGSPGVTTAVAALAAMWPADRALVVAEIDPSGGDLVVRFDLATDPGVVTLAASGRRDLGPATLLAHTQELPGAAGHSDGGGPSRRVLAAPVSADQATAALTALRGGLAHALDDIDADVIVDCGRLDPASPVFEVASRAELLVLLARPIVSEVHHLSARLGALSSATTSLLTVGERPYTVDEVAAAVGAHPLGCLPFDARASAALSGNLGNAARVLRRSRLLRDAGAVAAALAGWLGPAPATTPPTAVPSSPGPDHEGGTAADTSQPAPPLRRLPDATPLTPQPPPPGGPPGASAPVFSPGLPASSRVPPAAPQLSAPPVTAPPPSQPPGSAPSPAGRVNGRGRERSGGPAKHFRRDDLEERR
jgi:hypothetical protein